MKLEDWKRLVDEAANHKVRFILIRGGEPFMFPGIIELLEHIRSKEIFISVDTNGTYLKKYAADLIRIGNMHLTFSVDGPKEVHDSVRGVQGGFKKIRESIACLNELEKEKERKISKSICFTISKYNYKSLGHMPDVARSISINSMNIVPYYYVPADVGKIYEEELQKNFDCTPFSWHGFHHDDSGVDSEIFNEQHKKYLANLGEVYDFPYLPLTDDEYRTWFSDPLMPVRSTKCENIENLIDIQPSGEANFCVDYPDYSMGNVKHSAIREVWNSEKAERFRKYRREKPLAVCYRCGAKYISEIKE